MENEKLQQTEETEEETSEETSETAENETKTEEKPTLETINKKLTKVLEDNERLAKQNRDKDSHIDKIQKENKELRGMAEKVTASIEGKTEKQKDAVLDKWRQQFIEKGYDEKSVDILLEASDSLARQRASEAIIGLNADYAEALIENDPEVDKDFLKKNEEAILEEYRTYRQEMSPRKVHKNFKKAYNAIKAQLAEKGKKRSDHARDEMIEGGKPQEHRGRKPSGDEDFIKGIESAGVKNSHFI